MELALAKANKMHPYTFAGFKHEKIEPTIFTREDKLDLIKHVCCTSNGVTFEQIDAVTRRREIMQTRQLIMYFARFYTRMSLSSIGRIFKQRFDHSTVVHACKTITDLCYSDFDMRIKVAQIEKKLEEFGLVKA